MNIEKGKAISRSLGAGLVWSGISALNTTVLLNNLPFETNFVRLGIASGVSVVLGMRGLANMVKTGALFINPGKYYEKTDWLRRFLVVDLVIPKNKRRIF